MVYILILYKKAQTNLKNLKPTHQTIKNKMIDTDSDNEIQNNEVSQDVR